MNDTFSGQNSVAYYQAPATAPSTNDQVVPANPMPGEPVPVGGQVTPATVVGGDMGASATMQSTPAAPAMSGQMMSSQAAPATTANATEESADDIVKRLAARISAYREKESAQASSQAASQPSQPAMGQSVAPAAQSMPAEPMMAVPAADDTKTGASAEAGTTAESLDAQNIFELLGVMDGSDAEKEAFLDELQQVIWEDFLENDVQLLLTKAEMAELQSMLEQAGKSDAERQEMAVSFLEKLVPDLESIMLEKALELKKEMVFERAAGLRELHSGKPDVLAKITEAELAFKQDRWHSGAQILNSLT